MYKLLLLIPFFLLFAGCAQQTRELSPQQGTASEETGYSLEALDTRYHKRVPNR